MKATQTLLGLLLLGIVLGGALWTRCRPSPWPGMSAAEAVSASPSAGRLPSLPAAARSPLPDITDANGVVDLGDLQITLSVTPRPPVAFATNRFLVRVESKGTPVTLERGRISFEMTMPMGDHRYSLVPRAEGWQEAEVVLPMCASGNPRWYAIVEGSAEGRPISVRFQLDLAKP